VTFGVGSMTFTPGVAYSVFNGDRLFNV